MIFYINFLWVIIFPSFLKLIYESYFFKKSMYCLFTIKKKSFLGILSFFSYISMYFKKIFSNGHIFITRIKLVSFKNVGHSLMCTWHSAITTFSVLYFLTSCHKGNKSPKESQRELTATGNILWTLQWQKRAEWSRKLHNFFGPQDALTVKQNETLDHIFY